MVARELDALELKKRRAAQAHGWKERAAREMDIIIDDDDLYPFCKKFFFSRTIIFLKIIGC